MTDLNAVKQMLADALRNSAYRHDQRIDFVPESNVAIISLTLCGDRYPTGVWDGDKLAAAVEAFYAAKIEESWREGYGQGRCDHHKFLTGRIEPRLDLLEKARARVAARNAGEPLNPDDYK